MEFVAFCDAYAIWSSGAHSNGFAIAFPLIDMLPGGEALVGLRHVRSPKSKRRFWKPYANYLPRNTVPVAEEESRGTDKTFDDVRGPEEMTRITSSCAVPARK